MTGWLLSHRFVSDLIVSSNATRTGAWANYYRFFNRYKWSLDHVCEKHARLVVRVLVPADAVIMPSVDDTLYHKRGLSLFGVGMHHDARLSSKRVTIFSWAHSWVIVTGLQWAPPLAFSLPICFRLYHNKQGGTKGKAKQQASSKPKKKRGKHAKVPSEHLDTPRTGSGTAETHCRLVSRQAVRADRRQPVRWPECRVASAVQHESDQSRAADDGSVRLARASHWLPGSSSKER
ncbi:MAG: transposase [Planctomycetales bacterium]|jgi:hypothetical protein